MARQSDFAVRAVINRCLDRCRSSETPLACLAEQVEELRERLWGDADIHTVERAVLKVLLSVLATRYVEPYEVV